MQARGLLFFMGAIGVAFAVANHFGNNGPISPPKPSSQPATVPVSPQAVISQASTPAVGNSPPPTPQVADNKSARIEAGASGNGFAMVFAEPDLNARPLGVLSLGTPVAIVEERSGWMLVSVQGSTGWVQSSMVGGQR